MAEFNEGKSRTVSGKTSVSVINLGYVDLHRACLCARKEFTTFCIGTNYAKVGVINQDLCPVDDEELCELLKQYKTVATASFKMTSDTDILTICVPKPVSKNHKSYLIPLKAACQSITNYVRKGLLPVINSPVNPGICEEMVEPILESSGLKDGINFSTIHCLGRIDPDYKIWTINKISGVVEATTPKGLQRAFSFYRNMLEADVSDTR